MSIFSHVFFYGDLYINSCITSVLLHDLKFMQEKQNCSQQKMKKTEQEYKNTWYQESGPNDSPTINERLLQKISLAG